MTESSEETVEDALSTVLSGGALVFLGRGVALGMGFFTQLVMARLLSTSAYGSVIVALAVMGLTQKVGRLGLNEGMVRKIPQHEDSPTELRGIIRAGYGIGGLSAVVFAVALFLLADVIGGSIFDNQELAPLIRIVAVAIPFIILGDISVAIARAGRDAKPHTIVRQLIRPTLRFAFVGAFVALGFEAIGATVGQALSFGLAGLVAVWYAYRTILPITGPSKRMYQTMIVFSLPLVLVKGMNFMMSNIDTFLIEYYLASSDVGIYNIAFQIRNLVIVLLVTVGFLLPPMLSKLEKQDLFGELREVYRFVTKWIVLLTFPLFMSLIFVPHLWLGLLFGQKYLPGVLSLQILGAGIMYSAAMGVSKQSLVGLGHNRVVMYTTVVAVVANIGLNILFIPRFGIEGAALASTLSVVLLESLNLYVLYDSFGIVPLSRRTVVIVVSMGVIGGGIYYIFSGKSLPGLIGWGILYTIVVLMTSVSGRDVRTVKRLINDIRV